MSNYSEYLNEKWLQQAIDMQKAYQIAYQHGVIGVDEKKVHLRIDTFLATFTVFDIQYERKFKTLFPYRLSCIHKDVLFIAVADEAEIMATKDKTRDAILHATALAMKANEEMDKLKEAEELEDPFALQEKRESYEAGL